jgi:hypothetical protein
MLGKGARVLNAAGRPWLAVTKQPSVTASFTKAAHLLAVLVVAAATPPQGVAEDWGVAHHGGAVVHLLQMDGGQAAPAQAAEPLAPREVAGS